MTYVKTSIAAAMMSVLASNVHAVPFDIQIDFSGDTAFQSYFDEAAAIWEGLVTGFQNDNDPGTLVISASIQTIDGVGGTLAQAGPTNGVTTGGFTYATAGIMQFDELDVDQLISAGRFDDVVLHEMAHVMGFGTLWEANNIYDDGTGEYTGAAGVAAYQAEFDPTASYVPVELGGGPGTEDAHWDEAWAGGSDALMTGFLNLDAGSSEPFLSETTIQSFVDLGFEVRALDSGPDHDLLATVPLPAGGFLLLSALGGLLWPRRRAGA